MVFFHCWRGTERPIGSNNSRLIVNRSWYKHRLWRGRRCSPRSRRKILSGGDLWRRPDPDSRWIQFWEAKISGATCSVSSGPHLFRNIRSSPGPPTDDSCREKSTVEPANTQQPNARYKSAAPLNLKLPSLNIWDKSNSKLFMFCLLAGLQEIGLCGSWHCCAWTVSTRVRRVVFMGARESRFSLWRAEISTRLFEALRLVASACLSTRFWLFWTRQLLYLQGLHQFVQMTRRRRTTRPAHQLLVNAFSDKHCS